jgi:hypothetical protein
VVPYSHIIQSFNPIPSHTPFEMKVLSVVKDTLSSWQTKRRQRKHASSGSVDPSNGTQSRPYVNQLPTELLLYILGLTEPTAFVAARECKVTDRMSSWTLAHVCSQWRVVALGDASLWSRIVVFIDPPLRKERSARKQWAYILERTLDLTQQEPLSVWISCRFEGMGQVLRQRRWWNTVAEGILRFVPETRRIANLHIPGSEKLARLFHTWDAEDNWTSKYPWDSLSEITLTCVDPIVPIKFTGQLLLDFDLMSAPQLRRLTVCPKLAWRNIRAPWSARQLTHLSFDGDDAPPVYAEPRFASILQECSESLEHLEIWFYMITPPAADITFPNLKHLSIISATRNLTRHDEGPFDPPHVLSYIRCPNLVSLLVQSATSLTPLVLFLSDRIGERYLGRSSSVEDRTRSLISNQTFTTLIIGEKLVRLCERNEEATWEAAWSLDIILWVFSARIHPIILIIVGLRAEQSSLPLLEKPRSLQPSLYQRITLVANSNDYLRTQNQIQYVDELPCWFDSSWRSTPEDWLRDLICWAEPLIAKMEGRKCGSDIGIPIRPTISGLCRSNYAQYRGRRPYHWAWMPHPHEYVVLEEGVEPAPIIDFSKYQESMIAGM